MGRFYIVDNRGNIKASFSIYKGDTLVAEIKDLAKQIGSEAKNGVEM